MSRNKLDPSFYSQALEAIDEAIRSGCPSAALERLEALVEHGISRPWIPRAARSARRLGRAELGLRLLGRHVTSAKGAGIEGSIEERVEYAGALIRVGAVREGEQRLCALAPELDPQISFLRAMARVAVWDYRGSVAWLEAFLADPRITPYERQVAEVNLAAAWVHEREWASADAALGRLREQAEREGNRLLLGNLLELAAQSATEQGELGRAKELLRHAEELLATDTGLYPFFVRKWRAIVELKETGTVGARLVAARAEAERLRHWESVRDLDFHQALVTRDACLLHHLYFGTPSDALRARFRDAHQALFPGKAMPTCFRRRLGRGKRESTWELSSALRAGTVPLRLLMALGADFYRPQRLVDLHAEVFPGQPYHPVFSAGKLHQALRRLRLELGRIEAPIEIRHEDGAFSLEALGDHTVWLEVRSSSETLTPAEAKVKAMVAALPPSMKASPFSGQEFKAWAKVPERTAQRYLGVASRRGWLEACGSGRRYLRYRVPSATSCQSPS